MSIATITSKGQTTIPKDVRDILHLEPGDKIDFVKERDGRIWIRPAKMNIRDLKGLLKRDSQKTVSIEEMNAAIADAAVGGRQ